MRRIHPYYWSLWAATQAKAMPQIGFPSQVPFYSPARLSKVEVIEGAAPYRPPDIDDWRVVERIEIAVAHHRQVRPMEVVALEIWEGALVGAKPDIAKRCEEAGVRRDTCRRMAARAKKAVEFMY